MSEITHNSFTVTRSSLLVLAAEEQPVSLLLQLLRGGTLLRAAGHLLHRLRGARLALLPYPVPRLFGWLNDRFKNAPSVLGSHTHSNNTETVSVNIHCNAPAMRVLSELGAVGWCHPKGIRLICWLRSQLKTTARWLHRRRVNYSCDGHQRRVNEQHSWLSPNIAQPRSLALHLSAVLRWKL